MSTFLQEAGPAPTALHDRAAAEAYGALVCFKHGPPRRLGVELEWIIHHPDEPSRQLDAGHQAHALGRYAPTTYAVEPDASNASYLLALAALHAVGVAHDTLPWPDRAVMRIERGGVDFALSDAQRMIAEVTRAFVDTELAPHEAEAERPGGVRPELDAPSPVTTVDSETFDLTGTVVAARTQASAWATDCRERARA